MSIKSTILWLALGMFLCLVFLFVNLPDGKLHLVFCDVGQGDAELIILGTTQVLIDSGPDEAKINKCLARFVPFWDRKLELVINTHPEEDHLGALHAVAQKYEIGQFLDSGATASSESFIELKNTLKSKNVNQVTIKQGDKIKIGRVALDILWPPANSQIDLKNLNKTSIVTRLTYGQFSTLFEADITADEELALEGQGVLDTVEVLKVAHHGSKTSSSARFVAELRPKLAIFEVGVKNRFGHPNEATLMQFDLVRSKILRTDQNGTIEIVSDGNKWWSKRAQN